MEAALQILARQDVDGGHAGDRPAPDRGGQSRDDQRQRQQPRICESPGQPSDIERGEAQRHRTQPCVVGGRAQQAAAQPRLALVLRGIAVAASLPDLLAVRR